MNGLTEKKKILEELAMDTPLKRLQQSLAAPKQQAAPARGNALGGQWLRSIDRLGPKMLVLVREKDELGYAHYAIANKTTGEVGTPFAATSDRDAIIRFRQMISRPGAAGQR